MPARKYSNGSEYRYGFNGKEKNIEITIDDYDYGERIYDGRLGRWLSVDPLADKYPGISPYVYCLNNPIKFIDSKGEFVIDPAFKLAYPKVALILENADKIYYGMELPTDVKKVLGNIDYKKVFNDNYRKAFEETSTGSDNQIIEMLTNGKGPTITSWKVVGVNEDNKEVELSNGSYNSSDNSINIAPEIVGVLEFELNPGSSTNPQSGFGGVSPSKGDAQVAFKILAAEIGHEGTHKLRNDNKKPVKIDGKEAGKTFEQKAFGKDQGRLRAKDLQKVTKRERTEKDSEKYNYNDSAKPKKSKK